MVRIASLLILVALAGAQALADDSSKRPNIILVMADDVGYECFGCYGSQQYQTPNIDQMAAQGMRFTHCYSQPLCTPSRVKIMTGLSNARNYSAFSILNRDQKTIGHHFQEAGYQTLIAGKWQLLGAEQYPERFRLKGTWPEMSGFDHYCLWQVDKLGSRYWKPLLNTDGQTKEYGEDDYGSDIIAKYVTDFISERRDPEKPFFIYYPMNLVHDPFVPTPDSANRESKDQQRNFEDMVAYMDRILGQLVKTTEAAGIADETIILFTGDNGTHRRIKSRLGEQMIQGGKGLTNDSGTRVPLVVYAPGQVAQGEVSETLVDFSDFLPTLLQAAGAEAPQNIDGQSFWPQLTGKPGTPREWMYCYYCPRPERTEAVWFVRDQHWKLYGDGRFFHMASDPLEKTAIQDPASIEGGTKAHAKLTAALGEMPAKGKTLLKFVD